MYVCLCALRRVVCYLGINSYFCLDAVSRGLHALSAFCGSGAVYIAMCLEWRISQNVPDVFHRFSIFFDCYVCLLFVCFYLCICSKKIQIFPHRINRESCVYQKQQIVARVSFQSNYIFVMLQNCNSFS